MRFELEWLVWRANRVSPEIKLDLRDLNLSQSWSAHRPDSLQILPQLENQLDFSYLVVWLGYPPGPGLDVIRRALIWPYRH